jgi:hypothetical protein
MAGAMAAGAGQQAELRQVSDMPPVSPHCFSFMVNAYYAWGCFSKNGFDPPLSPVPNRIRTMSAERAVSKDTDRNPIFAKRTHFAKVT